LREISLRPARGRWGGSATRASVEDWADHAGSPACAASSAARFAACYLLQPIGIAPITLPGAAVLAHGLDEVEVTLIRFSRTPI
jgi:hypothetical protein